jgi:hypothetical protein
MNVRSLNASGNDLALGQLAGLCPAGAHAVLGTFSSRKQNSTVECLTACPNRLKITGVSSGNPNPRSERAACKKGVPDFAAMRFVPAQTSPEEKTSKTIASSVMLHLR